MRKGYQSERKAKEALIRVYGELNVIKVAIGGAQDFVVVKEGKLIKVVEIKECHQKKYYPDARDRGQLERMQKFCQEHNIKLEVWIRYPHRREWDIQVK
jgi:hypothetical protein